MSFVAFASSTPIAFFMYPYLWPAPLFPRTNPESNRHAQNSWALAAASGARRTRQTTPRIPSSTQLAELTSPAAPPCARAGKKQVPHVPQHQVERSSAATAGEEQGRAIVVRSHGADECTRVRWGRHTSVSTWYSERTPRSLIVWRAQSIGPAQSVRYRAHARAATDRMRQMRDATLPVHATAKALWAKGPTVKSGAARLLEHLNRVERILEALPGSTRRQLR